MTGSPGPPGPPGRRIISTISVRNNPGDDDRRLVTCCDGGPVMFTLGDLPADENQPAENGLSA